MVAAARGTWNRNVWANLHIIEFPSIGGGAFACCGVCVCVCVCGADLECSDTSGRCISSAITNANWWWRWPTTRHGIAAATRRIGVRDIVEHLYWNKTVSNTIDLCKTGNGCNRFAVCEFGSSHLSHRFTSVDRWPFEWDTCGWLSSKSGKLSHDCERTEKQLNKRKNAAAAASSQLAQKLRKGGFMTLTISNDANNFRLGQIFPKIFRCMKNGIRCRINRGHYDPRMEWVPGHACTLRGHSAWCMNASNSSHLFGPT